LKKDLSLFFVLILIINVVFLQPALADEFIVDSPTPTPYENVFIDLHSSFSQTKRKTDMNTPALESYVGVYPEYSIQLVVPASLAKPKKKPAEYGYGDVRLGIKHRFIQETKWRPQAAFYPKFTFPSGDPERGIGNRTWTGTIPFWMQKNWDALKVTTGGGYGLNPARDKFNFLFGGILLQYQFTKSLMLGNEIVVQEPRSVTDGSEVIYNFGGSYNFTPNSYVLFSTGHTIHGQRRLIAFLGFGVNWGPLKPPCPQP